PILAVLWMRRRALALAQIDAAGAWFGFFRTLNWLLLAVTLFWMTSGLGARQTLQDWIATLGLSQWKQAIGEVAIVLLPTFLTYFLCLALSYPIHARLRGSQWTRREFLVRQAITLGSTVVPMILLLAAVGLLRDEPEIAIWLFFSTLLAFQALHVLRIRITRELPQPLTTGELRDRIFALARRLGVVVKQVFILPAGKGQVANAYAAKSSVVMFTDYLLEHLSKREVDAIAAHELAHLRHKHPVKRMAAFLAAIFLPYYFFAVIRLVASLVVSPIALSLRVSGASTLVHLYRGLNLFEQWSQRDFVLLLLGMSAFYFLSRHHENVADATAVSLTGDAEAQITGLLKVNRLNLTPIRWGKASESWLTHPSTVRRVERIAAAGGLAPERLRTILCEYDSQPNPAKVTPAEDRYEIPIVNDPEKIRAALQQRTRTQGKFWLHLVSYVVPPVLTGLMIRASHLEGLSIVAVYLAGIVFGSCFIALLGVWLGEADRGREKHRLLARFAREHVPVGQPGDFVVGFAPGPYPRIYGTRYHWDTGFLILSKNCLQFVGEETRFSFSAAEIDGLAIGRGGPSWWKFERIHLRWKIDAEHNGIFNLNSLEPGNFWHSRQQVRELYKQLRHWHANSSQYPEVRLELANLPRLEFKQVTSISPATIGTWHFNVRLLSLLLPVTVGIAVLVHADMLYLCTSVLILRLIQMIPYWKYRDILPAFSQRPLDATEFQAKPTPAPVITSS
ncbi:MAG TPA: M48 family metalloprotease, partial [Candidatus Sulfotelmatobacter sp.]|nr:M48 family metalloprotease [Candidatus Sulfotelmatobacter sp.]